MDKKAEVELWVFLSRQREFRLWLEQALAEQVEALIAQVDADKLRRAQGAAAMLKHQIRLLDEAPRVYKP
jgi:hypothetical protein